jgi:hypothetical protein
MNDCKLCSLDLNEVTMFYDSNNKSHSVDREYHTDTLPPPPPERVLVVAILERAVRDLNANADAYERRRAISWFEAKGSCAKKGTCKGFSFTDVVEYLELGAAELRILEKKLVAAKEVDRVLTANLKGRLTPTKVWAY